MAIYVRWYNKRRAVIHWEVDGPWCIPDFFDGFEQVVNMAHEAGGKVTMLVDLYKSTRPPKVSLIPYLRRALTEPYLEHIIVVRSAASGAFFFETLVNVLRRAGTRPIACVTYVDTLMEAASLLESAAD